MIKVVAGSFIFIFFIFIIMQIMASYDILLVAWQHGNHRRVSFVFIEETNSYCSVSKFCIIDRLS